MKVVGLGQCALDYLFVFDFFPSRDTKKEISEWAVCGGGPVATALVTLTRLGINCSFYGVIGDDESGKKIEDSLRKENVDVQGLLKRPRSHSQTAFIAVEKSSGKRTIFWKRPSGEPFHPDELPDGFLDEADLLLLDGLMTDSSLHAARKAKDRKIPVMLDAGRVREGTPELASLCDYLVASEEFGTDLMKEDTIDSRRTEEALLRMRSLGAKTCTLTLGERGSMTLSGDDIFHTPAFKVPVVDTTGAGDVFHGGYIYGLLQKWDIRHVVRFASAIAALKCRKLGGRAGIPGIEEVVTFLGKNI